MEDDERNGWAEHSSRTYAVSLVDDQYQLELIGTTHDEFVDANSWKYAWYIQRDGAATLLQETILPQGADTSVQTAAYWSALDERFQGMRRFTVTTEPFNFQEAAGSYYDLLMASYKGFTIEFP